MQDASRPRILVVIEATDPNQKGGYDVITRMKLLEEYAATTIVTTSVHLRKTFARSRAIVLPGGKKGGGSLFFYVMCWLVILTQRYDRLFLAGISNAPSILFSSRKKVVVYGNTHPSQFGTGSEDQAKFLKSVKKRMFLMLWRLSLRGVGTVLPISSELEAAYDSYGIRPGKIEVQYMGVDLTAFHPCHDKPTDLFRCVYTGELRNDRGGKQMLEAARLVSESEPRFRLRLIGVTDGEHERISRIAKELGITRNLEFVPPVHHDEIPQYLRDSHVGISLLMPTTYYLCSPPTKIFEYMAMGLPVVANDICTHSNYVVDERNGLLTDLSPSSISRAILRLAHDRSLLAKLSENAVVDAQTFGMKLVLDCFLEEFAVSSAE